MAGGDPGAIGAAGSSAASAGGGSLQAAALSVSIDADTAPAEQGAQNLINRIKGIGDAAAGYTVNKLAAMSNSLSTGVSNVSNQLRGISSAFAGESPLTPLLRVLQPIGAGLDIIQQKAGAAKEGLRSVGNTAGMLTGVGVAIVGIGAALAALGAPLNRANADLATAISNTTNAVSGQQNTFAQYKSQIDQAAAAGTKFGFTQSDVRSALAKLTVQTGDPIKALKQLEFVEMLATTSSLSLGRAADVNGRLMAGQFRYLRQFNIYVANVANSQRSAERAVLEHTAAQQKLADSTKALSDFEARVADSRAKAQEKWSERVNVAQDRVSSTQQRLQEVTQQVADDETTRHERLADAVVSAQQRMADSERSLADLRARMAARHEDELASHQEGVENAQASSTDARKRLADLRRSQAAAGPPTNIADMLSRSQALKNAQDELAKTGERLRDAQSKPLQSRESEVSDAQQLESAETALTRAKEDQNKALAEQAKGEQETIAHRHQLEVATRAASAAEDALAKAKAGQAGATGLTLVQEQQEARLRENVVKATEKEVEAQHRLDEAKNEEANRYKKYLDAVEKFKNKEQGILENREHTWAGHLRKLKAQFQNFFADLGQHGTQIVAIGVGITAVTSAIELLSIALPVAAAAFGLLTVGMGPVIVSIALISLAIFELATHWSEVWGWIKDVAKGAWDWISHHVLLVASLFGPAAPLIAGILLLATHWQRVWHDIRTWTLEGAKFVVDATFTFVGDFLHALAGLFGWLPGLGSTLKRARDDFDDFQRSVNRTFDRWIEGPPAIVGGRTEADRAPAQGSVQANPHPRQIQGFAEGGWVKGTPGQAVPAVVHAGEFVVSRDMVRGAKPIPMSQGQTQVKITVQQSQSSGLLSAMQDLSDSFSGLQDHLVAAMQPAAADQTSGPMPEPGIVPSGASGDAGPHVGGGGDGSSGGDTYYDYRVTQHVSGSVVTERELMEKARNHIMGKGRANGGVKQYITGRGELGG